jgi:hypothetical protein
VHGGRWEKVREKENEEKVEVHERAKRKRRWGGTGGEGLLLFKVISFGKTVTRRGEEGATSVWTQKREMGKIG